MSFSVKEVFLTYFHQQSLDFSPIIYNDYFFSQA